MRKTPKLEEQEERGNKGVADGPDGDMRDAIVGYDSATTTAVAKNLAQQGTCRECHKVAAITILSACCAPK